MRKVYLLALGCPKNLVDSEILSSLLSQNGLELVDRPEQADVFIVTTCAFIRPAVEESIEAILELAQLKKRHNRLIVAGCLVERYKNELPSLMPEVDSWIGFKALSQLPQWIKNDTFPTLVLTGSEWEQRDYLSRVPSHPFSAYLKIAEGCSNHCSFCTIPFIRGKLRSRPLEEILEEAQRLVQMGVKELILVAQETTAYGIDLYGRPLLNELLFELDKIGAQWVRVLYAHPKRILSLIDAYSKCKSLVPYLDVPIQHVDDEVLKAMNRGMGGQELKDNLLTFRRELPHVKLRSTVMVGFPCETKMAFQRLTSFLEQIRFDHLGVFKYYAEEGTKAYEWGDPISDEEKEERYRAVMDLQYQIVKEKYQTLINTRHEVFIDRFEEGYKGVGRTSWQAPEIDGEVFIVEGEANLGEIVPVKIVDAYDYDLMGACDRKLK